MSEIDISDAARFYAAIEEALRRGGGRTDPEAVRAVALATLFATDSPGRLEFASEVAEESAYAAWEAALAGLP